MKDLSIVYQEACSEKNSSSSGVVQRQEDIDVESCSCIAKELLSNKHLSIPEYQRPYTWGKKEIDRLLEDLKDYFNNNKTTHYYYLGSIILHQEAKGKPLNIIDGQQRLTTLAIIQHIQGGHSTLQHTSPLSQQRILKNYHYLKEKDLPKIDLSLINITLVITKSEDDAYTFFESQNTGGVRLSGLDIIKAHHLRAIEHLLVRNDYAKRWESLHHIEPLVNNLLKIRQWKNLLNYNSVPSNRDIKGLKNAIIEEFSQVKPTEDNDIAYQTIKIQHNDSFLLFFKDKDGYDTRQPLNDGCNFIAYLSYYHKLYDSLFISYNLVNDKIQKFYDHFIANNAGSPYLRKLFEMSILLYVSKHGVQKLYEASLWLFRCVYSLRLKNASVKEQSIPHFLKETHLLDRINASFTHHELIQYLKSYDYSVNAKEVEASPIRKTFVEHVAAHFFVKSGVLEEINIEKYDEKLIKIITKQCTEGKHEKS